MNSKGSHNRSPLDWERSLGVDNDNSDRANPKYCVAIDTTNGWEASVVVTNSFTQQKATITVHYNYLPICYKFFLRQFTAFETAHNDLDRGKLVWTLVLLAHGSSRKTTPLSFVCHSSVILQAHTYKSITKI
jgi:hypothetical protein